MNIKEILKEGYAYVQTIVDLTASINGGGRRELSCPLRAINRPLPSADVCEGIIWPMLGLLGYTVHRIKVSGGLYPQPEPRVHLTWTPSLLSKLRGT
jgi:hypothetical protein